MPLIDRWMQTRRGIDRFDVNLPSPHWQVSPADVTRRAESIAGLLQTLMAHPDDYLTGHGLSQVEARIFDVILDMISSLKSSSLAQPGKIARAVGRLTSGSTTRQASPSCAFWSAPGNARST